ncbi:TonB-dependent receptor plug domain-containing protein [Aquimarina aquimarini]|uniref:TonB-dependent receptor plug domain-containing protein n=1 Tax=Aquimarina aquimarini TaxID=1191734 RepID=UPI000D55834C|nr:TonB-dependent receptor [Aquimarina aquimarini]
MNKKTFFGAAFLMLGSSFVFGQEIQIDKRVNELDEVVISDSKFKLKRAQSGKVITKITAKELEQSQGLSVATVLSRSAGLFINGNGSAAGQNLGVYIRGGRNRQVVIRVDGVTVSDPSSAAGDFDLRLLSVSQIQEIEILKGASSTLYGSGAATAVINIITKPESKKKISANFQSSIGTNQSQEDQDYDINDFVNLASINGTVGKVSYLASFGNQFTDGLSAAEVPDAKSDPFSKYNVYAKLGYQWSDNFKFHIFGNLDQYKNDFDAGASVDADNRFESKQLRAGSFWEIKYPNGSFTFTNSYATLERDLTRSGFPSIYTGDVHTFDAYNKYTFNYFLHTVVGANGSYSDFDLESVPFGTTDLVETISDNDAEFDIIDPYVNVVYASRFGLNVNAGARLNIHSAYDTQLVYNVNPSYSYSFGENYIKGLVSYSTAYITPSLFQLYDTAFSSGNPELEPEESTTIEGGIEVSHSKKTLLSVVYFNRTSENFITFDSATFANINATDDIKVDGVEVEASTAVLDDKLSVKGNYTFTNIDRLTDNIRIPKHMINATVGYQLGKKTYTSLSYQYNTERGDSDFANADPVTFEPARVSLNSFGMLDFYINHQVLKNMNVYATMSNITNEDYQEILGFNTKGRNVRIGFNLKF